MDEPKARARVCMEEVEALLKKHRCQIVTQIRYERVGDGDRGLIESRWAIAPEAS